LKKRFVRFNTDFFHKMLKDFNVFGYGTTFIDCTEIVGLAGKNVPELTKELFNSTPHTGHFFLKPLEYLFSHYDNIRKTLF